MKKRPFRDWLYHQTPRIVTLTGYVFGLAILLGAASTWFIQTPVSARASGTIRPRAEIHVFPVKTVLLKQFVSGGEQVRPGTPLARMVVDPAEVANHELSAELRTQITQAMERDNAEAAERYRAMLALIPQEVEAEDLKAGLVGWVTSVTQAKAGTTIPAHVPVMRVATDDHVFIETTLSPDRMPSIGVGDTVKVLLPRWSTAPFPARVTEMSLSGTFTVALTKLDEQERERLQASSRDTQVNIDDISYPVKLKPGKDEVTFQVSLTDSTTRPRAKAGQRITATVEAFGNREFTSKWEGFEARLVLRTARETVPEGVRQELRSHLEQGAYEISVDDVWVETGHCRLFSRLFSK